MEKLQNRDYTLIIDKSGSMEFADVGGKSRWDAAQESTLAFASRVSQYDPDGITVYTFAGSFRRYDNVGPDKVAQIFRENEPGGTTNLAGVLRDALGNWQTRKRDGALKGGDTIIVVTDGEPDNRDEVANVIKGASQTMDRDEELGILFLQIGKDERATAYLRRLDDDLQKEGAKFDVVDVKTAADLENVTMTEALTAALED